MSQSRPAIRNQEKNEPEISTRQPPLPDEAPDLKSSHSSDAEKSTDKPTAEDHGAIETNDMEDKEAETPIEAITEKNPFQILADYFIDADVSENKERVKKAQLLADILLICKNNQTKKIKDWSPLNKLVNKAQDDHPELMSNRMGVTNFYANLSGVLKLDGDITKAASERMIAYKAYQKSLDETDVKKPIQEFLLGELELKGNLFYDLHHYLECKNAFDTDNARKERKVRAFVEILAIPAEKATQEKERQYLQKRDNAAKPDESVEITAISNSAMKKYREKIMEEAATYSRAGTLLFSHSGEFAKLMSHLEWGQFHAFDKLIRDRITYNNMLQSVSSQFSKTLTDAVKTANAVISENPEAGGGKVRVHTIN